MTNESVGNFTEVCLVADQPFAKDTSVNISFEDITAIGQCNININTYNVPCDNDIANTLTT